MAVSYRLEDFDLAEEHVRRVMSPSPVIRSGWLSDMLRADVFLKLECLNPGHSFKIRGAMHSLLSQNPLPNFVVTASGGNHGLGVAIAARLLNIPCRVFLPISTSNYRVELLEKLGAEVKLVGDTWDDANKIAIEFASETSSLYIHPFADVEVITGQGTIVNELIDQIDNFDMILVSVGGGGLITGITRNLDARGLLDHVEVHSVETKGADSLFQSINAGQLVTLPDITSIAKTLGARRTTPEIFSYLRDRLSGAHIVTDKSAVASMVEFLEHEKILVEPATSCTVSLLTSGSLDIEGKRVVVVICGSNVTLDELSAWRQRFDV